MLTIEFPDGPLADFGNPATAAGVEDYRGWVQTNDPAAFDQLFVGGIAVRLGTPEVRTQQQATIAAYLAATG